MKLLKNVRIVLITMFFPVFAAAAVHCPPNEIVTNLHFLKSDGAVGIWDLYSERFNYANKTWEVIFTVYLPSATTNEEAIQQGEDFYKYQVVFFDSPLGSDQGNKHVCYSAQQESTYFVRAITYLLK